MNFRLFSLIFSFLLTTTFVAQSASQLSAGTIAYETAGAIFRLPGTMRDIVKTTGHLYQIAQCTEQELYQKLETAIFTNNTNEALYIIMTPSFNPNTYVNHENETFLMAAAFVGNPKIISALLKKGANLHACNIYGQNAFFYLATYGNCTFYKKDQTVTICFNKAKFEESLELLLNAGLNLSAQDAYGNTPVMVAAAPGIHSLRLTEKANPQNTVSPVVYENTTEALHISRIKIALFTNHLDHSQRMLKNNAGYTVADIQAEYAHLYPIGSASEHLFNQFCS